MQALTEDQNQKRSMKILHTRFRNGNYALERKNVTWKGGWREIGDHKKYYRSKWEANYARYLQWLKTIGQIQAWEHEADVFWFEQIKRGVLSYLPDFKITNIDGSIEYHEVKGWMDSRSKTKIKRMAKYYPDIKLIVIDKKNYYALAKQVGRSIIGWE